MSSETVAVRVAMGTGQTRTAIGTSAITIGFVTIGPQVGAGLGCRDAVVVVAGVRRAFAIIAAIRSNLAAAQLLTRGFGAGHCFAGSGG